MNAVRSSTLISTIAAASLGIGGIVLLFGADTIVPLALPGAAASAAWVGQLVAAGWLAVAWLDWHQRRTLLGGIYGRATVLANFVLCMITSFSLVRPALSGEIALVMKLVALVFALLALAYAALLLRGPFGDITPMNG